MIRTVDHQIFDPGDGYVKGDSGESAKTSCQNGDREQPLPFVGQSLCKPSKKFCEKIAHQF